MTIAQRISEIRGRIDRAAASAGRDGSEITLVAVSKTFPAAAIDEAVSAGITDLGENRVQEARDKKPQVHGSARWHLIGHLQSNKTKDAVRLFDMIESVDSIELAAKIARAAEANGKTQQVLVQVNVGREAQKDGVDPTQLQATLEAMKELGSLEIAGLMTIPPIGTPEESRRYFSMLRSQFESARGGMGSQFRHLSMGMSEDFEVAVEEGATIVRVGRAIFGGRN